MKTNDHLFKLLDGYINKNCTEAEKQELLELLADPAYETQWNEIKEAFTNIPSAQELLNEADTVLVWEAIRERTLNQEKPAVVKPLFRKWWAAAAVTLLMLGAGTYFWLHADKRQMEIPAIAKEQSAIVPGEAGAVLKLDDGRVIVLDSAKNGLVASNTIANVIVQDGNLTYQPLEGTSAAAGDIYNTMETMRGKIYRMTLPDGTKVWLNASTQIRYPIAFNGDERRIRLKGEAYFEVAENAAKPFIVEVEKMGEVKVLGTHFNVNAYPEERAFTTTLLQGKVQLNTNYSNTSGKGDKVVLMPSEQAIIRENQDIVKQPADLEKTMAWKNGQFVFKTASLQEVFNQLGRWYDVSFVNEENLDAVYSGSMYRTADFYELLRLIEFTTNMSFRVEGRKVFVTKKK